MSWRCWREVPATPLPQGAREEEEQLREPLPRIRAGLAKGGARLAEVVGARARARARAGVAWRRAAGGGRRAAGGGAWRRVAGD